MTPSLKLYYAPGACSLASHIALEESGLAYESQGLSLAAGEQRSAAYLEKVAAGKVPALQVGDRILMENVAILTYVDALAPDAALLPLDGLARAEAVARLAWFSNTVHPAFRYTVRAELLAGETSAKPEVSARSKAQFIAHCGAIDDLLAQGDWILGDRFSACDGYAMVFFGWMLRIKLDLAATPNLRRHAGRMLVRPAVARVLQKEGALAVFEAGIRD